MTGATILVADDDAAIRTVLNQALSRAGYDVRITSNAATLWRWISAGDGDLVLTDVVMPDENAFDLLPRIMISTAILTPLMVYLFIPLSTRLLAPWLQTSPTAASRRTHSASSR